MSLIFDQSAYLSNENRVISIVSNRGALILAAMIEIGVVVHSRYISQRARSVALVWLGALFSTYKLMEGPAAPDKPCRCLGSLAQTFNLSVVAEQAIAWTILVFIVGGGLVHLASEFLLSKPKNPSRGNGSNAV